MNNLKSLIEHNKIYYAQSVEELHHKTYKDLKSLIKYTSSNQSFNENIKQLTTVIKGLVKENFRVFVSENSYSQMTYINKIIQIDNASIASTSLADNPLNDILIIGDGHSLNENA